MQKYLGALLWTQVLTIVLLYMLQYSGEHIVHKILRVVLALCFLVLPGYWLSLLFFDKYVVGAFERFIMSLALALLLIIIISFYAQQLEIHITTMHTIVLTCGRVAVVWIGLWSRISKSKKEEMMSDDVSPV